MQVMSTFKDRLTLAFDREKKRREEAKEKKLTKTEIWQTAGASSGAATHWFSGNNQMDMANCMKVAPILRVNPFWLYDESKRINDPFGQENYLAPDKVHQQLGLPIQTPLRPLRAIDNIDEAEHDIITIPRYTLKASAGNGQPVFDVDERGEPNYARLSWVRRHGFKPGNLFTIVAIGDSMEPEIHNGDSLTVHRQIEIESGKLMVICYRDECFVKQLLKQVDGYITIRSFNPDYHDTIVAPEQLQELFIVGRVVNISRNS
jgi:phage repressor protein C with HTH and peptisase S24 domain